MTDASTWFSLVLAGSALCLSLPACHHESSESAPEKRAPATEERHPAAKSPDMPSGMEDVPPEPDAGDFVPPGSPVIPLRPIDFAIYLSLPAAPALLMDAEQKVRAAFPKVTLQKKPEPAPPPSAVVFVPDMETFGLPTAGELARFEHGLSPAQMEAAPRSKGALLFGWLLDADPKMTELRKAQDVVLDVAEKAGGLLWDDATREIYAPAAWKKLRIDGWQGDIPDARRFFTTHYYKTEGRNRLVTLGLAKLGLPDLVVLDVPVMQSAAVVTVLDAIAQLLVEGAVVGDGGKLAIDLKAVRHTAARAALLAAAAPDATFRGSVVLGIVEPEEGDAENRLAEVHFDGAASADESARLVAAVHGILGAVPEQMAGTGADDPELKAIAKRTQAKLPALATAFRKGLPKGDELSVSIPFAGEGESFDWAWIKVTEWKGDVVHGILRDETGDVNPLTAGGEVEAKQGWIGDYIWQKAGGAQEGGESMKVLARRMGGKP